MKKLTAILLASNIMLSITSCDFNKDYSFISSKNPPAMIEQGVPSDGNTIDQVLNETAMQMYEAAIHDEICVIDEHLGETKLKDYRFTSDDTRLEECKLLKKAILDVNQDGVKECVIQSPNNDYIILRYYNGKVYSYCLDSSDYYNFNTDGTFYWYDSSEAGEWECGLNKLIFDGETLNVKSIYSLNFSKNPTRYEYYIGGEAVTENECGRYRNSIRNETMKFAYFELTCSYPITAEQAWNLANAYWDHQDGRREQSAGTIWTARIVLIDTPNLETDYYRVAFQVEWNRGGGVEGYECMPPHSIEEHDQILVNAFTGEIIASTYKPGGKVLSVEEAIEIAKNYYGKLYYAEYDAKVPAPDHIYVIVFYKDVNRHDYTTNVWVDKYTGEIVSSYYVWGK